jgi:DNA-binding GntR family transcriptional regulator
MTTRATELPALPGLNAISRRSAKDSVIDEIRGSIMRGSLQAGARIVEHKVAASLNVSQTTVREALVDLEHLGFVQRVPPRKTFVTRLTRRDIEEIYAVRVPMEELAIELLAHVPSLNLKGLEQPCAGMKTAAAAEDRIQFESMDLAFHRALWSATGNRTLEAILEKIVVKLFAFGFVMNRQIHASRARMEEQAMQHSNILALLTAGDFPAAKQAMASSMDKTWLADIEFSDESTSHDSDAGSALNHA